MKALIILLFPFYLIAQSPVQQARKEYEVKNFDKSISILEDYIKTYPKNSEAIELLGDAYGKLKQWEDAKKQYKLLSEKNPKNANYHYKYGGVLGMMALENKLKAIGLIDDIKTEFRTAAELDPNHIDVRWALVEFYMELPGIFGGSMDTAVRYANELEEISKVDGYLAKGFIYEKDGNEKLAETFYKKAKKIGGSKTCFEKLAEFYDHEKRYGDAINVYLDAAKKFQTNDYLFKAGEISAKNKISLLVGLDSLKTYIDNFSDKNQYSIGWAHYLLAQVYRGMGQKTDAMGHISVAIQIHPEEQSFQKEKALIQKL
ncbi:tetratricopeptide repeat protein [Aegicerativicinus sediminis]|uniref:tetratricopeptide repeat protein n=1 Tax=Aegicerativicinus sediminis TaxID=2893202 RepID=UPI001E61759D|nr:tetratricopeptide repeat protein [Aegicerativicinus sediminis]